MGTTRRDLERRLAKLARRMGCCEKHGTRLQCSCNGIWTGTEAELTEVLTLLDRILPYYPLILRADIICPTCGLNKWCERCNGEIWAPVYIPDEVISPQELDRYRQLCGLMRARTPEDGPVTPRSYSQVVQDTWDATPPEPGPAPLVAAVAPPDPPEPPAAEVDAEEDAAVDAELTELVAQLQERLKR